MPKPEQLLPAATLRQAQGRSEQSRRSSLSREEIAQIEVGNTTVAPATVRVLLAFFLTAIAVVPIVEWTGVGALRAKGVATAWSELSDLPGETRSHLAATTASVEVSGLWRLVVSTNRIVLAGLSGLERALEDESLLGRSLRPHAQLVMTDWLGAGNERVYPEATRCGGRSIASYRTTRARSPRAPCCNGILIGSTGSAWSSTSSPRASWHSATGK
jgi:hypothetical protein